MAKNYLSLERLREYDALIKAKMAADDAAALESANKHTDEEIAKLTNTETGILAQAKSFAATEDAKVQGAVDTLETYVGTIPTTATATDIVGYINEKTAGIATEGAMNELDSRVGVVEGDVATIKGDYLKGSDKTELSNAITLKADQTALDKEVEDREAAVSGLQTQINTIMNNPDAENAINSINEFTQYVTDHATIADGFRTDINKNKDDIAAMDTAYKAADTAIKGRLDVLEAIDHEAYVAADTALKNELNVEIAKKATNADLEAMGTRVGNLETASATHALKTEVEAVSSALTEYSDAHKNDYTNAKIDELIKVNTDAIAALNGTYATDAELETAISGEVTRANNTYAAKATTLAGYGIGDAYTTTQADAAISEAITQYDATWEEVDASAITALFAK